MRRLTSYGAVQCKLLIRLCDAPPIDALSTSFQGSSTSLMGLVTKLPVCGCNLPEEIMDGPACDIVGSAWIRELNLPASDLGYKQNILAQH